MSRAWAEIRSCSQQCLVVITHFLYVLFDPGVRRLYNVSGELDVTVNDHRLVRPVRIDAHLTGVHDRLGRGAPLPAQLRVTLELPRVRSLLKKKQTKKNVADRGTSLKRRHPSWRGVGNIISIYRNYLDYPDNYPFGRVRDNRIIVVVDAVCVQTHHQVEVPLVRVRFPFLPHVVARGLTEVQSANRHF